MDYRVTVTAIFRKALEIIRHVHRGGAAELAAGIHVSVNVVGRYLQPVDKRLSALYNGKGEYGYIVFSYQFLREIAGAVGCDFYIHCRIASLKNNNEDIITYYIFVF